MKVSLFSTWILAVIVLSHTMAFSADLYWGGVYRAEGLRIDRLELEAGSPRKTYATQSLILTPQIFAADHFRLQLRLDVWSSAAPDMGTAHGSLFGSGVYGSNSLGKNMRTDGLTVNEAYIYWNSPYGEFRVGRAPIDFGFGAFYNSGQGLFDHYLYNLDLFEYRFRYGKVSFIPAIGIVDEMGVGSAKDAYEMHGRILYENPETELQLGAFYRERRGNLDEDFMVGSIGGEDAEIGSRIRLRHWTFHSEQKMDEWRYGVEAHIVRGDLGLTTSTDDKVTTSAFAIVGELDWKSGLQPWGIRNYFGYVSGNDPSNDTRFEGMALSRNYRVAKLLFRHPLGQEDLLGTDYLRQRRSENGQETVPVNESLDFEAISNVIYMAPQFYYSWSDEMTGRLGVAYGHLVEVASGADKSLGVEVALGFDFQPFDRFIWETDFAFLLPGSGWKSDQNFQRRIPYGVMTRAALSF